MALEIKGLEELNKRLRKLARTTPEAVERGSFAGALMIQGEAQKRTPVEYGTLQGSAYTKRISKGAETGFSAEYALFVHENTEERMRGKPRPSGLGSYWNPGESQFLLKAVNENQDKIVDLIEQYVAQELGV